MSQNMSLQARDMSQLSRKERIDIRNQIIISQVSSGVDRQEIAKQFTISLRQVHRIIKEIEDENQEWYQNLPKKGMAAMFRYNSMNVFSEITTLTNADLTGANLQNANFGNSDVTGTNFAGCTGTPIGTPLIGTLPTCTP